MPVKWIRNGSRLCNFSEFAVDHSLVCGWNRCFCEEKESEVEVALLQYTLVNMHPIMLLEI